ncbi:uncharacterized protein VP01_3229g4 [Puccinia sorghi]|uniref:GAG-pre-integrase domain-containing protein n=1 Tax=Puccinia sorghi TaxID=27349 RepID=A0A0L6V039_9BASI|nr:uncharacterized protein VP01_3229g4 [Puccinia sorghi]
MILSLGIVIAIHGGAELVINDSVPDLARKVLGGGRIEVNNIGNTLVSFPNGFSIQSFSVNCCWQIPALVASTCPIVFVPHVNHVSAPKLADQSDLPITIMNLLLKESDALMWHRCLGRVSLKRIMKMCSSGELPGLPSKLTNKDFICEDCLASKSKRHCSARVSDRGELKPMDMIVLDFLGPFVEGFSGFQCQLSTMQSQAFIVKTEIN